jgi:hypothetical protein
MNRIKLMIAATVVAVTLFGIGTQALATQSGITPVVGGIYCCIRP